MIDGAVEAAIYCGGQRLPRVHDSWWSGGAIPPLSIQLHPVLQLWRAMPTSTVLMESQCDTL